MRVAVSVVGEPLQWGVAGDAGEKAGGDGEKADDDGDATLAWLPWVSQAPGGK